MSSRKRRIEELFDLGDACDDAPESIGSYDLRDDFIDDSEPVVEDSGRRVRQRQGESSSSGNSILSWSASLPSSPLFEPQESPAPAEPVTEPIADPSSIQPEEGTFPPPGCRDVPKRVGKGGKRSGDFRCKSRRLLLTYAKVGGSWSHSELVKHLTELDAGFRLGREFHKDGTVHYHCYVDFRRQHEFENCHKFCYGADGLQRGAACSGTGHCNILVVWKTPHFVWDYPGKDGPESILHDTTGGRPAVSTSKEDKRAEGTYCLDASTRDEFLARVKEVDPWALVKSSMSVEHRARALFPEAKAPPFQRIEGLRFNWESFPTTTKWILGSLSEGEDRIRRLAPEFTAEDAERIRLGIPPRLRGGRAKSLILWGESLHGKTDLARHLGPHIHWERDYRLQSLLDVGTENIDYLIIDDIDWSSDLLRGSAYKAWLGGQHHFIATDKWVKKLDITWGKPCIFLCNEDPLLFLKPADYRFIMKNCYIEHVREGHYVCRRPDDFL